MADKTMILDDTGIRRMLNMPSVVQAFPFMQNMAAQEQRKVATKTGRCGGCGRKANAQFSRYDGLRTAIAGMSSADKEKLKKLLGVQRAKIYFLNVKKQRISVLF